MGEGLGGALISYLDTQAAVWLGENNLSRLSATALEHSRRSKLLISPMVLLECQYLFDIKRTLMSARDLKMKLERELGVQVCDHGFPDIATVALDEGWTQDPFDRIIVAHAKANNFAYLISSDEKIKRFYPRTVW